VAKESAVLGVSVLNLSHIRFLFLGIRKAWFRIPPTLHWSCLQIGRSSRFHGDAARRFIYVWFSPDGLVPSMCRRDVLWLM
jgi:hypothetical protein